MVTTSKTLKKTAEKLTNQASLVLVSLQRLAILFFRGMLISMLMMESD